MLSTDPVIASVEPAYVVFSLCCKKCHAVQHMRYIPPRVAEEQLQWVQVTPYHLHNLVNLPRHLLHMRRCQEWIEIGMKRCVGELE